MSVYIRIEDALSSIGMNMDEFGEYIGTGNTPPLSFIEGEMVTKQADFDNWLVSLLDDEGGDE